MASKNKKRKAQNRAKQRKRKQDKRRKNKSTSKPSHLSVGLRQQQQLDQLTPNAWAGETPVDVAVFCEATFSKLNEDQQSDISSVKEALRLAETGLLDQANQAVATIARKSQLSDWRLLIRGLTAWLGNDLTAANRAWSRLDRDRRPARIATALQLAHRDNLKELAKSCQKPNKPIQGVAAATTVSPTNTGQATDGSSSTSTPTVVVPDLELVKAARSVRRMRIDRAAIKIAGAGVNQKIAPQNVPQGDSSELFLWPEQIKWLYEFGRDFRSTEPKLVRALEIAALDRASVQSYVDVFDAAIKTFKGPPHDPRNLFRSFHFWSQFEGDDDKADGFLNKYIETDLPFNEQLSQPLRDAIASTIWRLEADFELQELTNSRSPFSYGFYNDRDSRGLKKSVDTSFKKSIKAYPKNEKSHVAYVKWLQEERDEEDLAKKQKEQAEKKLTAAMLSYANAIPNAPEPRTYLAETYLAAEQFEDAAPHIQWIVNSRPEDPRLKILPWKSKLFEAMNLCRRKSNLPQVPAVLEEVKSLWPEWLSTRWLPYFTAAWLLRSQDQSGYEKQREATYASQDVKRESLMDACMMLGAAQRMKVPSTDLKPLREPIDAATKNLKRVATEDLIDAGSFFWEMYQSKIHYPAFRMHGSKFGREILKRFKANPSLLKLNIDKPAFRHCVFWFSEHRFWGDGYESKIPPAFKQLVTTNDCMAAAHLNGMIQVHFGARNGMLLETAEFLRDSIRTQTNPFYRYWYVALADAGEAKYRKFESETNFGGFRNFKNIFGSMFGNDAAEQDECDCEDCRARRAQQASATEATQTNQSSEATEANLDDGQTMLF